MVIGSWLLPRNNADSIFTRQGGLRAAFFACSFAKSELILKFAALIPLRRNGRVVDGGSLENCCTATYRGFESLFLRKAVAKKRNELARLRFFDAGLQSSAAGGEGCGSPFALPGLCLQ